MATIYEGMFLLDNQVVREDWKTAKALVTGTLEKHGGKIHTARRWDERPLAYPIKGRKRATYLITYYELPGDAMQATRLDFDLSESVLRYLWLKVDEIPEEEKELSEAENASDFTIPEPPDDDAVEEPEEESEGEKGPDEGESAEGADKGKDGEAAPEAGDGAEAKDEAKDEAQADAEAETGEAAPVAAADEGSKEN